MNLWIVLLVTQTRPVSIENLRPELLASAWPKRLRLQDQVASLCRSTKLSGKEAPHGAKWAVTKTNELAQSALANPGRRHFPEGSILIKEKYSASSGGSPMLYTAMIKRTRGFNPQAGDWEYFVVNLGPSRDVIRTGMDGCIKCHQMVSGYGHVFSISNRKHPSVHLL